MKKITLISFCLAAFAFASCAGGGCPATGIIPAPQQVTWGEGAFRMPAKLLYTTDLDGQDKADLAAWMQRAADGFFPASFAEASDGDMPALELLRTGDGAPESYRLDVSRTKITLTAPDAAGLFYGLQSLAQLAGHHGRRIPAVTIVDAPRFGYRGFMLDVSRHFRDKEFVERQLDLMARYKLNRFHWHLTDGAGWRIEIKKYPALTDIAAWRPYPDWEGWNFGGKRYCHRDDPAAAGGYYTQDDIREVVEYARALHIEVIPEIEMPGHSEEVLAVYPELSCSGKPYTDSDFCIGNEKLIHYLNDVKFSFNSYTMNLPSQVMGVEAVKDDTYFKATTAKIIATRERVKKELTSLGFTFPDSKANFIFASHKEVPAEELFRALREADIYVRHWNKPRISNSLRISVGTDEEMDRLIAFLKEYLEKRV